MRFLYARKFDVQKAVQLYEANIEIRVREGLYGIDSSNDPLLSELKTGKFTILVSLMKCFKVVENNNYLESTKSITHNTL